MCRKLGKGHKDYIVRREGLYAVDDQGVKRMRRAHNGKRVDKHHGTNALSAYTDLRDKLWSWVPDMKLEHGLKTSAKNKRRLERLERSTMHGMTRHNWPSKRSHLMRNNVCVVSYMRDNFS